MKIDKHNLPMHGLRKASGETKDLAGYYSGHYVQISYDIQTGDVITDYHYSLGQNSWTKYHDANIITICNASEPMTMQEIADAIANKIKEGRIF